jgi:hypothetical protein
MNERIPSLFLACALAAGLVACGQHNALPTAPVPQSARSDGPAGGTGWWKPAAGLTYQSQYGGKLDMSVPADVYDVDYIDTSAAMVAKLHSMGRHVVCYISFGTWENWRPDAKDFPKSVIGNKDGGWNGEHWLDVRQTSILEPIMQKRLELCKSKGFDAVDPDNLDGFENRTGFTIGYAQQLAYNSWIASAAHKLGLGADQKGDNDQTKDMEKVFDFAVVEQCYKQGFCKEYTPYTSTNRLVVDVEYGLTEQTFKTKTCPSDKAYGEFAMLKKLELTAWIVTCP